jgi:hypothetical protein
LLPKQDEALDQANKTESSAQRNDSHAPNIYDDWNVIKDQHGQPFIVERKAGCRIATSINSDEFSRLAKRMARTHRKQLNKNDVEELKESLIGAADENANVEHVFYRCATNGSGIEIDLGDDKYTRILVTADSVTTLVNSDTVFRRTAQMKALPYPADVGDTTLLTKRLKIRPSDIPLLVSWITYTMAHPKVDSTNYVHLVIIGGPGTGKTILCKNILLPLIDPSSIGLQSFPKNEDDLCIQANNAQVLCFDNLRYLKPFMSDLICQASSGATITKRALYTNDSLHTTYLHAPIIFNGIHDLLNQPDLAQRCLVITTKKIDSSARMSEAEMLQKISKDLPAIFRGLLDIIANILKVLPDVQPSNPTRMVEFSHWIAAYEHTIKCPTEIFQSEYTKNFDQSQLDSLVLQPIVPLLFEFAREYQKDWGSRAWTGTPAALLELLREQLHSNNRYSSDLPKSSSTLSKKLKSLVASLQPHGIEISFSRGKFRQITIIITEEFSDAE